MTKACGGIIDSSFHLSSFHLPPVAQTPCHTETHTTARRGLNVGTATTDGGATTVETGMNREEEIVHAIVSVQGMASGKTRRKLDAMAKTEIGKEGTGSSFFPFISETTISRTLPRLADPARQIVVIARKTAAIPAPLHPAPPLTLIQHRTKTGTDAVGNGRNVARRRNVQRRIASGRRRRRRWVPPRSFWLGVNGGG